MPPDMLVTCLCDTGHGIGFYWTCRDIKRPRHKSQRMLTRESLVTVTSPHQQREDMKVVREWHARGQDIIFYQDFKNHCCGNCIIYHNFRDDVRLVLTWCWVNTRPDTRYQTQTFIFSEECSSGQSEARRGQQWPMRGLPVLTTLGTLNTWHHCVHAERGHGNLSFQGINHLLFLLNSPFLLFTLNSPCIVRKVLGHVEIHGHVVTIVRVAPHPFTLHHLSPLQSLQDAVTCLRW